MTAKKKTPKKENKTNKKISIPKGPGMGQFLANILSVVLIMVALIAGYSLLNGAKEERALIPLSELAREINDGSVGSIVVRGEKLEITLVDETLKESKKETESSLSETLSNYGVAPEALSKVSIDIQNPSGIGYWLLNVLPFLLPVLFILLFFWMISRQVKGAGMQAFTFGQSKARIIEPGDKNQRVTFADVAGAKEAKEELIEVVDFLRNPKKFLDIGAQIPKGVLLMGAPGTGKCVSGDTMVATNKGMIPIDEIPKYFTVRADNTVEGLDIVSADPKTLAFDSTNASHWYELGKQKTRIIETDLGNRIEGTQEHPVVVMGQDGNLIFKRLDEITKGEYIVIARGSNVYGSYTKIPDADTAYLLGALVGDGCLTVKDRICFTSADKEIIESIQKTAEKLFGKKFSKTSSRPYDYTLFSVDAKARLRSFGLEETYARNKHIPEWIRIAPKPFITAFLRGLFDTDGTVEQNGSVSISSASETLALETQALLLNMGIVARMFSRKKKYNGTLQFYLTIYGDFIESFSREIGFSVKRKSDKLARYIVKQRNTNVNLIPGQSHLIKNIWQSAVVYEPRDRAFYENTLYKNVKRYINEERTPSVSGVHTFIAGIGKIAPAPVISSGIAYLQRLASGDFFFTKIKNITSGETVVYDLTVPQRHNFVANGFINHNTLIARAVAGEAGVPFFNISGSEFVEMFVGVGASRVRDLFKLAKKAAPAIIFIDEIDAVGRSRGVGMGGGNDEREQTLNQILVEMDGFEPAEKVIIMAATNRPDVLDPALLRPGRFDRRVIIDEPDVNDREEILKIHSKKKPFAEGVNLRVIAERTPGFSGADLQSLMNEGAILAARENRKKIEQNDLIRSIEKVMLGPERRSHLLSKKEKGITAYHEAGHALVSSVLEYADPVHKVSIVARGRAGGYTLKLPYEERKLQSRKGFLDDLAVSLGGYAAEKLLFDDLTTGPSNDLQVSTALARDMVTKYGMSEKMGPVALEEPGGRPIFGREFGSKDYSERVSAEIDAEVSDMMKTALSRATNVIIEYRSVLEAIAKKLMAEETIEHEGFENLLRQHGIVPKQREEKKEADVLPDNDNKIQ